MISFHHNAISRRNISASDEPNHAVVCELSGNKSADNAFKARDGRECQTSETANASAPVTATTTLID
jgi:hypothetical protein